LSVSSRPEKLGDDCFPAFSERVLKNFGLVHDGSGVIHSRGIREPGKPASRSFRYGAQPGRGIEELSPIRQHLAFEPDGFQILVCVAHSA
jgi:hypothetical protein